MLKKRTTLSRATLGLKAKLGLNTQQLFKERSVVPIRHQNELYYLRLTKNNKVILTK